jgi:hypothetical protein
MEFLNLMENCALFIARFRGRGWGRGGEPTRILEIAFGEISFYIYSHGLSVEDKL